MVILIIYYFFTTGFMMGVDTHRFKTKHLPWADVIFNLFCGWFLAPILIGYMLRDIYINTKEL